MATLTKDIKYEDFVKILIDHIKVSFDSDINTVLTFAFEGFSATAVFKKYIGILVSNKIPTGQLVSDLVRMLGLFHVRGPNISKMSVKNTSGSQDAYDKIKALQKLYDLKSKGPNSTDITLPRLSMIFARVSNEVYLALEKNGTLNHPVSATDISIANSQRLFPNFLPCLISEIDIKSQKDIGLAVFIHNMYQMVLSFRTQRPDQPKLNASAFYDKATKFSMLATRGTLCSPSEITTYTLKLKEYMTSIDMSQVKASADRLFDPLPTTVAEEVSVYHKLINHCIENKKSLAELTIQDWNNAS